MASPIPQRLREELIVLLEEQLNVLEKETFGVATKEEILEYPCRQERIRQLYNQLLGRRDKAA